MKETVNLKLKKPEYIEDADIEIINENMNTIDEHVTENADGLVAHKAEMATGTIKPHGINTAAAEIYEEGSFTPMIFGTTTTGEPTYNNDFVHGQYMRIGKIVHIQFFVGVSNKGGMEGNLRIGGLPFAPNGGGGGVRHTASFSIGLVRSLARTSGYDQFVARIAQGTSALTISEIGNNSSYNDSFPLSQAGTSFIIGISGTYRI